MASIISVDNIRATGTSTNAITIDSSNNLGDITMNGEGGTNTLSVRQGVAKGWLSFNGTGTIAARDSLNHSSLTDNGTGDYTITHTNSMDNTDYVRDCYSSLDDTKGTSRTYNPEFFSIAAGSTGLATYSLSNYEDHANIECTFYGDLA